MPPFTIIHDTGGEVSANAVGAIHMAACQGRDEHVSIQIGHWNCEKDRSPAVLEPAAVSEGGAPAFPSTMSASSMYRSSYFSLLYLKCRSRSLQLSGGTPKMVSSCVSSLFSKACSAATSKLRHSVSNGFRFLMALVVLVKTPSSISMPSSNASMASDCKKEADERSGVDTFLVVVVVVVGVGVPLLLPAAAVGLACRAGV